MTLNTSRFDRSFLAVVLVAAVAAGLTAPIGTKSTEAALPGANNRIVFASNRTSGKGVDNPQGDSEIFTMKPDGRGLQQLTTNAANDYDPTWSAQDNAIAFVSQRDNDNEEIYMMDADGGGQTRLTNNAASNAASDRNPTFYPDGSKIAFTSNRASSGTDDIFVMDAIDVIDNGTGDPGSDGNGDHLQRLTTDTTYDTSPAWSPDGTKIAFESTRDDPQGEIYVKDAAPESAINEPIRLTNNTAGDFHPNWSPDGNKIAFTSDRDGNRDIYVMNALDGSEPKRLTKRVPSDTGPAWSPDGSTIAFRSERGGGDPEVYVMKAKPESKKNRPKNLTRNDAPDSDPAWQPAQ